MLNRNYNALLLNSTKIIKIARFSDTLVGSAPKSWHFRQLEQTYAIHDTKWRTGLLPIKLPASAIIYRLGRIHNVNDA